MTSETDWANNDLGAGPSTLNSKPGSCLPVLHVFVSNVFLCSFFPVWLSLAVRLFARGFGRSLGRHTGRAVRQTLGWDKTNQTKSTNTQRKCTFRPSLRDRHVQITPNGQPAPRPALPVQSSTDNLCMRIINFHPPQPLRSATIASAGPVQRRLVEGRKQDPQSI